MDGKEMLDNLYGSLIFIALFLVLYVCHRCCCDEDEDDTHHQPAESAEQRAVRASSELQASAAALTMTTTAKATAPPPVLLPLPYFPYAAARRRSGKPSETVVCAICLETLLPGVLCSEVPRCRHVFHGDCLGEWARSSGSCPLCRARIVPGSDQVAVADDMV